MALLPHHNNCGHQLVAMALCVIKKFVCPHFVVVFPTYWHVLFHVCLLKKWVCSANRVQMQTYGLRPLLLYRMFVQSLALVRCSNRIKVCLLILGIKYLMIFIKMCRLFPNLQQFHERCEIAIPQLSKLQLCRYLEVSCRFLLVSVYVHMCMCLWRVCGVCGGL